MSALQTPTRASGFVSIQKHAQESATDRAPIVTAVDGSRASGVAAEAAVKLAADLGAPIVFIYVRPGPAGFLGEPAFQRRLTKEMARARHVLDRAFALAAAAGVDAEGEILEGSARSRIAEFARDRGARLIVVGSRRHRLGRSVSGGVVSAAGRPVLVARGLQTPVLAANVT
jgi:nucleotide-binding universal stress UspA family protein